MDWMMVMFDAATAGTALVAREVGLPGQSTRDAKLEDFMANDPEGFGVTIISMVIVMLALVIIYFVFKAIGPVIDRTKALKAKPHAGEGRPAGVGVAAKGKDDKQVAAAIGLALYQHLQAAREDEVISLTIKEISRRYSPWNDKGYAVMNNQVAWRNGRK